MGGVRSLPPDGLRVHRHAGPAVFDLDGILDVLDLDDDGPVVTLDDVLDMIEAEWLLSARSFGLNCASVLPRVR